MTFSEHDRHSSAPWSWGPTRLGRSGCPSCRGPWLCRPRTGCRAPGRDVAGSVELLTHKSVEEVKRYYLDELRAAGFDVRDAGLPGR